MNMNFGQAIEAMKEGKRVARLGWNGTGMFAYYVPGGHYPAQTDQIKGVFENDMVPYRPYLALKTAQNDVACWSPSTSDSIAVDWYVVGAPVTVPAYAVSEGKCKAELIDEAARSIFALASRFDKVEVFLDKDGGRIEIDGVEVDFSADGSYTTTFRL